VAPSFFHFLLYVYVYVYGCLFVLSQRVVWASEWRHGKHASYICAYRLCVHAAYVTCDLCAIQGEAERNIRPNTPLFVQDLTSGVMLGLFEATAAPVDGSGEPGVNPKLPVQIRFRLVLRAPPVSLQDPQVPRQSRFT
jgi:hypothetical protein